MSARCRSESRSELQTLNDASLLESSRLPLDAALGSQTIEASKQPAAIREQNARGSSVESSALEELDRRLQFTCSLAPLGPEDGRWLQRVERHFSGVLDQKQSLLEELSGLARQAGQALLGEPRSEELVSFWKQKDYLLRRAELLDRDDELSKGALDAKNTLRRLL